jgi:hypothetical protein
VLGTEAALLELESIWNTGPLLVLGETEGLKAGWGVQDGGGTGKGGFGCAGIWLECTGRCGEGDRVMCTQESMNVHLSPPGRL